MLMDFVFGLPKKQSFLVYISLLLRLSSFLLLATYSVGFIGNMWSPLFDMFGHLYLSTVPLRIYPNYLLPQAHIDNLLLPVTYLSS